MAQIPKDCYIQYDELAKKRENQKISFEEMIQELTKNGYWVEVDWKKMNTKVKKNISSTPMLLVHNEIIEKNFSNHILKELSLLMKQGYQIYISANIVKKWGYPTL